MKPGLDFFAYYITPLMLLIFYIILFYTDMDQDSLYKEDDLSSFS